MPVLPLLRDIGCWNNDVTALWHSAGAVCVDDALRTCAGRAVDRFRAAARLARLAGRRCCRLRHHGDGASFARLSVGSTSPAWPLGR